MREHFLLDPDVIFLNHGSFGATPRPVFEVYQQWQRRLEAQPVKFLGREIGAHLAAARAVLGSFVNADAADLVFVPNATTAVNIVARSLPLGPDDEVLTTNHEYGACENVWRFLRKKRGFGGAVQSLDLPFTTPEVLLEQFWQGVTPRTKVIFMSHITSPTAVRLPVEAICTRAREAGILTIIDAAHAVGQIPLDMQAIGADFYASNAHKWLSSPKGSAFLYARPEVQHLIDPLVVGWGWGEGRDFTFGSDFVDYLQYIGTDDYSAYLSVPAAIQFQTDHDWTAVRTQCHALLNEAIDRLCSVTGRPSVYASSDTTLYEQMAIAPLPPVGDLQTFKNRLYDEFRVEIPCIQWHGRQFIRVSVQGYNTHEDIDALVQAMGELLPRFASS
jgi:isopenicillin-N epimerase